MNKRIRDQPAIRLPLRELLALFLDGTAAPMPRNFALVYAEMAFDRAPAAERLESVRAAGVGMPARKRSGAARPLPLSALI